MSQEDVAVAIGMSVDSVGRYEAGKAPRGEKLGLLAHALGVSIAYLMGEDVGVTPSDKIIDGCTARVYRGKIWGFLGEIAYKLLTNAKSYGMLTASREGRRSPEERGENSMKQITREDIIEANAYGLNHRDSLASYRTPVLMCALLWGQNGIDLSSAPTVSGWRHGKNVTGISHNYREDVSEYGLYLAALDGETACGSEVWFAERDIVRCQGVLLPKKGSDGEPLVLPIGGEDLDN